MTVLGAFRVIYYSAITNKHIFCGSVSCCCLYAFVILLFMIKKQGKKHLPLGHLCRKYFEI